MGDILLNSICLYCFCNTNQHMLVVHRQTEYMRPCCMLAQHPKIFRVDKPLDQENTQDHETVPRERIK